MFPRQRIPIAELTKRSIRPRADFSSNLSTARIGAAAWTVTSAMAAHLPRIVEAFGATPMQAVFAGMVIGPAQVAARVVEASLLSRFHPLRLHTAGLPHPSRRFGRYRRLRRRRCRSLRPAARRRQWHPDHRPRDAALAIFGPGNYAYRLGPIGAVPDLPGNGAARLRAADRTDGASCRRIGGPQSLGLDCPSLIVTRGGTRPQPHLPSDVAVRGVGKKRRT
jgi:hypothetical protein